MGDGPRGIEVFPDHFQASTSGVPPLESQVSPVIHQRSDFEVFVFDFLEIYKLGDHEGEWFKLILVWLIIVVY